MVIWHNPRCSKSREALQLLEEKGEKVKVRLYLKDTPTNEEIIDLILKLDIEPEHLVRKSEAIFKEQFKGKELSDLEWIEAMVEHPKLIERPIFINGEEAIIGRPPALVLDIL